VITDCYERPSVSVGPVKFFVAPPALQITSSPACLGVSNGSITVTITSQDVLVETFEVLLYRQILIEDSLVKQGNYGNVAILTSLKASNYRVVVKNNSNKAVLGSCETIHPVEILVGNFPTMTVTLSPSDFNGKNISCNGAANGSIQATVNNANLPIKSYTWSGTGTANNSTITNCGPGDHSVTVTDDKNCVALSEKVSLSEPAPLTLTLQPTNATCAGVANGSITSTAGGGMSAYTFTWSHGASAQNVSGLGPGNYTLTLKDINQCSKIVGTAITQPAAITFSIIENISIDCPGDSTGSLAVGPISGNQGAVSYLWSSNETFSSINNKPAGSYWLKVTDTKQCSTTHHMDLHDPQPYSVQISPTIQVLQDHNGSIISCFGESDGELRAALFDPEGDAAVALSYQWSRNNVNYISGQTIYGLNAANYKVVATNDDGCRVETTYNLQHPTPVSVNISQTSNFNGFPISCPGESNGSITALASGGTPGGYTYEWQDGPVTQNFNGLAAGDYFVTTHDINGCEGTSSYQLNDPPTVVPSIVVTSNYNGQAISCTGKSDGILTAFASGGASPYTFTWSHGPSGKISNNLLAGSYSVQAMDANGCKEQSSPTEVFDPEPVEALISILSDYNGQAIRCHNTADGILQAGGTGGTNSFSYAWSTNAITPIINDLPHGNYSVVVTDQNGCSNLEEIELINPELVIAAIDSVSDYNGFGVQCHGSQNGFIRATATGGTKDFNFYWPVLTQPTNIVEDLGVGNYTVNVTDSNGCPDDESFEITEPPILTLDELNHTDITCYGGSDGILVVVSNGGFGTHEYSINSSEWQLLPDFSALVAEIPYIVSVKDENQCLETFETQLAQPDEIKIEFSMEPAFCADPVGHASAIVSGGVGNFSYKWSDATDNVISSYASITKQLAGIYTLLVHDDHQCPMEKSIGIASVDGPVGKVVESAQTSCFNSADGYARVDVVNGKGPFTVAWEGGENTWEVSNLTRGNHYVSVTDGNNCVGIIPVTTLSPEEVSISLLQKNNVSCYLGCDGSIEINASGGNGEYAFKWNDKDGTQRVNNLCAGAHDVEVTDKLGCQASQVFNVTQPDRVEVRVVNRKLPSCNADCNGAIEVDASGGTGVYSYSWSAGSDSGIQDNICAGNYTVIARDGMDCTVSRAFDLGEPTRVEIALIKNQSPTCYQGCDSILEVLGYGGVGNFRITWADGSTLFKNASLCAGDHEVVVVDANNCKVTEKYSVLSVPQLQIDLGGGVVVCEGQQHELNAGSSWKKVEWTISERWISSSVKIQIVEPGIYRVQVFDVNNCSATDSFVLETSDDLLQASFIMAAQATVGDTVVLVDISWPLPDDISWTFPNEMIKLLDNHDVMHGKFEEAGDYDIILNATLGLCKDEVTKTITILDDNDNNIGGRLGAEEFLKTLTLHPNPNTGTFELEAEFSGETPITVTIWNLVNTRLISKTNDQGSNHYRKQFDLHPITSGTYLLRLDYEGGHKTIRFLVH
jgi:hypothetical protein